MCGVAGFLRPEGAEAAALEETVAAMAACLAQRGPDDTGAWCDPRAGLALGFRRLAILDVSPAGHQPMHSASGRYVIVFNGEAYNFRELRQVLAQIGHSFGSQSDTEVVLAAIEEWGIERALGKLVGMFAFAVWDNEQQTLHLVRDRLGIKPLFYGWSGGTFLFGSELKALRTFPEFAPAINRDAVALQIRYGYIPQPYSIYEGIWKLAPGSLLTLRAAESAAPGKERILTYWSAKEMAERAAREPFHGSPEEALEELESLLRAAIRAHMVSYVPLGAFLSGGIDSSTVVALMQRESAQPVRTFTIGVEDKLTNEAAHARDVAARLGTDHRELYVTPREAQEVIPRLPTLYDEPFADVSQIPTFLVSSLARREVKVALSGDGGDELFGGYLRYHWAPAIWRSFGWLPQGARRALARALKLFPAGAYNASLAWLASRAANWEGTGTIGDKVHKLADLLPARDPEELYHRTISHWRDAESVVIGAQRVPTAFDHAAVGAALHGSVPRMMLLDLVTYLPDDILTKLDRASMGVSLEARVPYLDHRVVEFAARLPAEWKVRGREGKWLLRRLLYRHAPRELVDRPKMGFDVPIGEWLRGPLRDWGEALLAESRLRREGFFSVQPVRRAWEEHLAGKRRWDFLLWDVLMFQAWLEARASRAAPSLPSSRPREKSSAATPGSVH